MRVDTLDAGNGDAHQPATRHRRQSTRLCRAGTASFGQLACAGELWGGSPRYNVLAE